MEGNLPAKKDRLELQEILKFPHRPARPSEELASVQTESVLRFFGDFARMMPEKTYKKGI